MRSAGFFTIVVGIALFIVGGVIAKVDFGDMENITESISQNAFANWLMAFSPILVLAGIGFILYDVAREGDDKLSHL